MNSSAKEPAPERRRNLLLRELVDDMLVQLRELQRHAGPLSAEERARLEDDLERIMTKVRLAAFSRARK
jgi:hypothetical protein